MRVNEVNGNVLAALDVIEEMPEDVKTIKNKELLISIGTLRAKEVGYTITELAIERTERHSSWNAQSSMELCCNKRAELLRKVKRWSNLKKRGKNKGDSLLVAATVLASMAYQAVISLPGGVISMDVNEIKVGTKHNIKAGTSILAQHDPVRSKLFWIFYTSRAAMWTTVPSMALAYLLAAVTLTPDPNIQDSTYVTLLIAASKWYALTIASLLFLVYRFIIAASRKAENPETGF
ncbi:uncharacterized protein LOC141674653 [Apium graveolens]|uniref:uncharacterized protein LOC141674653 n=1 Tax=Apium graveolens TaxID=4045 RepID=UPI003D7BEC71